MPRFSLVTCWVLDADLDAVWSRLVVVREWPAWWRNVLRVIELEPGGADGIGSMTSYVWIGRIPYRVCFDMRVTAVEQHRFIEGVASGDLNGIGRWELQREAGATLVRYRWTVSTGRSWMNALAPVLAPLFRWNHDEVMAEGGRGLARHLGVTLVRLDRSSRAARTSVALRAPSSRGDSGRALAAEVNSKPPRSNHAQMDGR